MIKARAHLIFTLPEEEPLSFRTDVLALTRDPEWVYQEALGALIRALLAIKKPAHRLQIISQSFEWVPSLRDKRTQKEGTTQQP